MADNKENLPVFLFLILVTLGFIFFSIEHILKKKFVQGFIVAAIILYLFQIG